MAYSERATIIETGSAFPAAGFSCEVHSVFKGALNLMIGTSEPFVTLLTEASGMHPLSALVRNEGGDMPDFTDLGFAPGMRANNAGGALLFESGWKVSALGARRRTESEDSVCGIGKVDRSTVADRGRALQEMQERKETLLRWSFFADREQPSGASLTEATFENRFVSAAGDTVDFLTEGDARGAIESSLSLVGFGQGLTPSGDDFLCGLSLAAWIRSGAEEGQSPALARFAVQGWLDGLLEASDGKLKRTSDVSLAFLRLARRGLFSRALLALAFSFETGSSGADFEQALEVLRGIGHSSGLDSATGFFFGLRQ